MNWIHLELKKVIITKPNQITFKTWRIFLIIKSKTLFETIRFAIVNVSKKIRSTNI